jgi:putative DNA primase/helicase
MNSLVRFTTASPCPVCGGAEGLPRGKGVRCYGYLSFDGKYAHCTREDHAGPLPKEPNSDTYAHRLEGSCRCGTSHAVKSGIGKTTTLRPPRGPVTETYPYVDESGKLLFHVRRHTPKDFSQRRPDGAGGWIRHLSARCPPWCPKDHPAQREDARRVLYHLPLLLAAPADATVFVVEGEKDVHALERIGLVATTNPGGAGKWRTEYAEMLRDRHVVVILDNDAKGRAHAKDVERTSLDVAKDVHILELPGLPEGGDVSDWLGKQDVTGSEDLKALLLAEVAKSVRIGLGSSAKKSPEPEWPDPIPFDSPARLPEFPVEALPPPIAEFAAAVAESRQVPPDLPALAALGVLSAAAARRFVVRVHEDYFEPLNLFIAAVLGSGERKSATLQDCTAPLGEFERELQELSAPAIAVARERRELEEARLKHLRQRAAKDDDPEAAAAAVDLAARLTPVPAAPRLIVGDATVEKLASMLVEQGGRIAHIDAEAGIFGTLAGRYTNGRANFDVFLRGHAGDDLRVDRMGRTEVVLHPALTVVLTPQPSVLPTLADEPQFRGRGLLARFLYALPQSRVGFRHFVQSAVRAQVRSAYRDAIRNILKVEPPATGGDPGHALTPSAGARAIWIGYYNEIEQRQCEDGDLRGIRDWASKAHGAALRIAGLLHLAAGLRPDRTISDETMSAAWAIVRNYLVPHALEAFTMIGADRDVEQARKIVGWIVRTRRKQFTRRDAHKNFAAFGEPDDFDRPLHILENRFIVRLIASEKRDGPGRPPSPTYDVNPRFLGLSSSSPDFRSHKLPSEWTKLPWTPDSVHSDGTSRVSSSEIRPPEPPSAGGFVEDF